MWFNILSQVFQGMKIPAPHQDKIQPGYMKLNPPASSYISGSTARGSRSMVAPHLVQFLYGNASQPRDHWGIPGILIL
jgi:hypothetical protein